MSAKIMMYCDGIMCKRKFEFEIPGWIGGKEVEADGHHLFCPACELQEQWFSAVCPGCVEGYPDCGLSESFAYKHKRIITQDHLDIIRNGVCPFRINGTSEFRNGLITSINLSEKAPEGSGAVITDEIEGYCKEYSD